jgi:hypothetical protein
MFLLFNVVGWALNELGLADGFVMVVEILGQIFGIL